MTESYENNTECVCGMVLVAGGLSIVRAEEDASRHGKAFPDVDRDGWDNDWVAKYPGAKLDSLSDPDGDGRFPTCLR
ncbi:MAG: hypothetical protein ACI8XO_000186 [Verrucomicrobiales bacterium]|jgi:hypothetical protein